MRVKAVVAFALAASAAAACGVGSYQGSDAGAAGSNTGASSGSATSPRALCSIVLASDYDQSCTLDSDCVEVGQVPQCPITTCDGCTTEAINRSAMAPYMSAFKRALASSSISGFCGCPCTGNAICRGGKCEEGFCEPSPSDTLPACANGGGTCVYSASTICNGTGPPDSCAYSDELCCLN
jgi:hypothetical protein